MKAFISQRPNIVPTGVGNSEDPVDISAILDDLDGDQGTPSASNVDTAIAALLKEESSDDEDDDDLTKEFVSKRKRSPSLVSVPEDEADADSEPEKVKQKIRVSTDTPAAKKSIGGKKTPARATASAPATKGTTKSAGKKLKMADNFSDIAVAEEATRQKTLELQIIKAQQDTAKYKAKLAAQVEKEKLKAEKMRLNAEMLKFKLRQEHEIKLARISRTTNSEHLPSLMLTTDLTMRCHDSKQRCPIGFRWKHGLWVVSAAQ